MRRREGPWEAVCWAGEEREEERRVCIQGAGLERENVWGEEERQEVDESQASPPPV